MSNSSQIPLQIVAISKLHFHVSNFLKIWGGVHIISDSQSAIVNLNPFGCFSLRMWHTFWLIDGWKDRKKLIHKFTRLRRLIMKPNTYARNHTMLKEHGLTLESMVDMMLNKHYFNDVCCIPQQCFYDNQHNIINITFSIYYISTYVWHLQQMW